MTFLQVEEAFSRACFGEPVRKLAREYGVDESALRERFKRGGATVKQIRVLAYMKYEAEARLAMLTEAEREAVRREVGRMERKTARKAKEKP